MRKAIRKELEEESRAWNAELVNLYAFLQRDERKECDGQDDPGLMAQIRSVIREELYEHTRIVRKE